MPIKRLISRTGFDIIRYTPSRYPALRCAKLRNAYAINLVLDVGANEGQYANELRRSGYSGRIVSFEPVDSAYRELERRMRGDAEWKGLNCALGDVAGEAAINVGGSTQSSSLRQILPVYQDASPHSKYVGCQQTHVRTLDEVLPSISTGGDQIWLKVDAQGFEKNILLGARDTLSMIDTVQLELCLVPLYEGQARELRNCTSTCSMLAIGWSQSIRHLRTASRANCWPLTGSFTAFPNWRGSKQPYRKAPQQMARGREIAALSWPLQVAPATFLRMLTI